MRPILGTDFLVYLVSRSYELSHYGRVNDLYPPSGDRTFCLAYLSEVLLRSHNMTLEYEFKESTSSGIPMDERLTYHIKNLQDRDVFKVMENGSEIPIASIELTSNGHNYVRNSDLYGRLSSAVGGKARMNDIDNKCSSYITLSDENLLSKTKEVRGTGRTSVSS